MIWTRYGKALTAVALALVTALHVTLSDGHVTQAEAVQVAIAAATATSVWLVPNVPQYPWAKTLVAMVLAVLNAATALIVDGISSADWAALILAVLTVATVGAAPAESVGDHPSGHRA
jgi:hypothetical protein